MQQGVQRHSPHTQKPLGVWKLIVCVNLTGSQDAQLSGYTLYLGVSVRVFLEEVNNWINRLSQVHCLPQCGWTSPHPLRVQIQKRGEEGWIRPPCAGWAGTSMLSCAQQHSWCSGLQTWTGIFSIRSPALRPSNHTIYFLGLSLQTAGRGTVQPPSSHESIAYNKHKYKCKHICLLLVLFLWRTLTNTGEQRYASSAPLALSDLEWSQPNGDPQLSLHWLGESRKCCWGKKKKKPGKMGL